MRHAVQWAAIMTLHSYNFSEGQKVLAEGTGKKCRYSRCTETIETTGRGQIIFSTVTAPRKLGLLVNREVLVQQRHYNSLKYLQEKNSISIVTASRKLEMLPERGMCVCSYFTEINETACGERSSIICTVTTKTTETAITYIITNKVFSPINYFKLIYCIEFL